MPIAVLAVLGWVALASGTVRAGSLTVGARVAPYTRLEAAETPGSLVVTLADVRRGWVRAAAPLAVTVRSNDPSGYRLDFRFAGDFVTGARLTAGGQRWALDPGAASIVLPGGGATRETLEFDVRLTLAAGTSPGVYYWPLEVASAVAGAR